MHKLRDISYYNCIISKGRNSTAGVIIDCCEFIKKIPVGDVVNLFTMSDIDKFSRIRDTNMNAMSKEEIDWFYDLEVEPMMEALAPLGCFYGYHWNNGCIGFWSYEEHDKYKVELVKRVVSYLWYEEEQHYISNPVNEHIFLDLVELNKHFNLGFKRNGGIKE